ncbi:MAG: tetratricopeptide repeat protein [Leptospiraceae bacterium]|nr:tetratricopeptide repeat protein [Leptospiraceae bacterium]
MKQFLLFLTLVSILSANDTESLLKAKELFKNKSYDQALEILEKSSETTPLNVDELKLQAKIHYAKGNVEDALDSLYLALKQKSKDPEIYLELVKLYSTSKRYKGALEVCENGIKKFPNSLELNLQLASLLPRFGKVPASLQLIEKLKAEFPSDPRPLSIESNLYLYRADFDKAEISIKWAISLDEKNQDYKNNLAIVYEKKGDFLLKQKKEKEAKESFELAWKEIQSLNSNNPIIASNQERIKRKAS